MSCMNVFWCVFSLPPLQQQIITKAQNDHDHLNPEKKKILENLEQKYPTESNQKCIALSITIFILTYSPFSLRIFRKIQTYLECNAPPPPASQQKKGEEYCESESFWGKKPLPPPWRQKYRQKSPSSSPTTTKVAVSLAVYCLSALYTKLTW